MMLAQGHTRDLQQENQSPRRFPALWAAVTNDMCIRRCRGHPNNVPPLTYLVNSLLIIF